MKRVKKRVIQRQGESNQEQISRPPIEAFSNNHNQTALYKTRQNTSSIGPPPLPVQKPQMQNFGKQHVNAGQSNIIEVSKSSKNNMRAEGENSFMPTFVPENHKLLVQLSPINTNKQDNQNGEPSIKAQQDEKKARIQMLKQKYLKKNPEKAQLRTNQPVTKAAQKNQTSLLSSLGNKKEESTKQTVVQSVNEIRKTALEYESNKEPVITIRQKNLIKKEEFIIQNLDKNDSSPDRTFKEKEQLTSNQKRQFGMCEKKEVIQENSDQKIAQDGIKFRRQDNNQSQQFNNKAYQNIKQKKVSKTPPPPPINKNKSRIPPPAPVKHDIKKPPQQKQIEQSAPEIQSQKKSQQQSQKAPIFIPLPPPPSRVVKSPIVQEILTKKLKKTQIMPSQPFKNIQISSQSTPQQPKVVPKKLEMKIDEQFQQKKQQNSKPSKNKQQKTLSLVEKIKLWIDSPLLLLQTLQIIPSSAQCEKEPVLSSANPGFSLPLNQFISQFVFKNIHPLTAGQKEALYSLSLEYFFSSGEQLSLQMLLLLVKIGQPYLQRHVQYFKSNSNFQHYLSLLYKYRSCLSQTELATSINFFIEQRQITQNEATKLLLLQSTQKIISILQARSFTNREDIVILLSVIQATRKDSGLIMGLYIKLINSLLQTPLPQATLESILKHVGQFQPNQKFYNVHKQLKLRIISLISSYSNSSQKPQPVNKQQGISEGLIGYWSLAVGKLKTATTQFTSVENKAPPKPLAKQEEQKEDDIVYDPVLKRYLINGKVPDDDDSKLANSGSKAPPPPPRPIYPGKQTVVPPPVVNGTKKRVLSNMYT